MTVSGFVALLGAVIGATAIRAKAKGDQPLEAAEAEANPGGEALAAEEVAGGGAGSLSDVGAA